jgi:hypothetical protein
MGDIGQSSAMESANRIEPGSFPLNFATFPDLDTSECNDPIEVANQFVDNFNRATEASDVEAIVGLFQTQGYWRDQLCLSWDFHTLQGLDNISKILKQSESGLRVKSIKLDTSSALRSPRASTIGPLHTVAAFLIVETDVGRGAGIVNLIQDHGVWKVYTLFTYLTELKGQEESTGSRRPNGYEGHDSSLNWLDRRESERKLEDGDPSVLILGECNVLKLVSLMLISYRCWSSRIEYCGQTQSSWNQITHRRSCRAGR